MSVYPYKKTPGEKKTVDFSCIFCGRHLTHSELFFFGNHCIIDRMKYNIKQKDVKINDYKK